MNPLDLFNAIRNALNPAAVQTGPQGLHHLVVPPGHVLHERHPMRGHRSHTFTALRSFAEWLNRHANPKGTEILLTDKDVSAGLTPTLANSDVIYCDLVIHPRAARWISVLTKPLTQREFYRLLLVAEADFPEARASSGESLGSGGALLASEVAKVRVRTGHDYDAELDARGNYKVRSTNDSQETSGKIPSRFTIRVPWFIDVEGVTAEVKVYDIDLYLDINVDKPSDPRFVLTCPGIEMVKHAARSDAAAWLQALLVEDFLVGLGAYETTDVRDYSAATP